MDNNRDHDYIRDRFRSDGIKAPDSLSESDIMKLLDDQPQSDQQFRQAGADDRRRTMIRRLAAAAACAVIALAGVPAVYNAATAPPDTSVVNGELYTFGSYREIDHLIRSMDQSSGSSFFRLGSNDYSTGSELIEDEAVGIASDYDTGAPEMKANGSISGSSETAPSHSETYLQVEDVDEADIIKTDGKYIYYVDQDREVIIYKADNGKAEKISVIGNTTVENYISDIFLKGDTLVTVGRVYDEDEGYSAVVTYDISDRTRPHVINEFRQTGDIVSSRMVGDYVYLVTTDYVYSGGRHVPKCTVEGIYTDMPYSDISCVPEPKTSAYTVLSAIDISSGKAARSKSKAVFGSTDDIYCNDHNLYAAVTEWNYDPGSDSSVHTRILRASLDGLRIRFDATAAVRGYIDDQFSMNEKDGYFYIATTADRDGMDVNNLFVLDGGLKEVGKLAGFARNESIKAVRYVGDKAYVITYEQIDPLFIIDLSVPEEPRIEGEVEITGFSSLLVPVSEERMLGIGFSTEDNGYGGEYSDGLKLALFDISDPSSPEVLDSRSFKDAESPAQYDHLALTVNSEAGWYAIPYGRYTDNDTELIIDEEAGEDDGPAAEKDTDVYKEPYYDGGVLVFGADDSLNIYDEHHLADDYLYRSIYIGDYIYALDGDGNVYSFNAASFGSHSL